MSHKQATESDATVVSNNEDNLSAFLLERLTLQEQELEVDTFFQALVKLEGSDLHMRVGSPPLVRIQGDMRPLKRSPIDAKEMVQLLVPMMDERNRRIFRKEGGADFADIAKQHSQCPSGQSGGALGEFEPGQMVKEFDDVVFSAEINQTHGPVKTQFGYHLIEITSRED